MNRHGFTLMELLIVIVIIALFVALLLPVVWGARRRAYIAQCISNMHQIGQAVQMYSADHNHRIPGKLVEVQPYVKDGTVFLCPSNPFAKGRDLRYREGLPTVYWTILDILSRHEQGINLDDPDVIAAGILRESDPNHGIMICDLHGRKWLAPLDEPVEPTLVYTAGLFLRLRVDTSVQRIHVEPVCVATGPGTGEEYVPGWLLYTDVPCPNTVPEDTLVLDCPPTENVVPCE